MKLLLVCVLFSVWATQVVAPGGCNDEGEYRFMGGDTVQECEDDEWVDKCTITGNEDNLCLRIQGGVTTTSTETATVSQTEHITVTQSQYITVTPPAKIEYITVTHNVTRTLTPTPTQCITFLTTTSTTTSYTQSITVSPMTSQSSNTLASDINRDYSSTNIILSAVAGVLLLLLVVVNIGWVYTCYANKRALHKERIQIRSSSASSEHKHVENVIYEGETTFRILPGSSTQYNRLVRPEHTASHKDVLSPGSINQNGTEYDTLNVTHHRVITHTQQQGARYDTINLNEVGRSNGDITGAKYEVPGEGNGKEKDYSQLKH